MRVRHVALPAMAAVLSLACRANTERRTADLERMRVQQRYDLFESSAFFADGMTMRMPPPGTVSSEHARLGVDAETGLHGGTPVSDVPASVPITRELLARGREDFAIFCTPCHGDQTRRPGIVGANLIPTPPTLFDGRAAARPAGTLFRIIGDGFGRMPPYRWALPVAERWAIVAYLRSVQEPVR